MRSRRPVYVTLVLLAACATTYSVVIATQWELERARMQSTVADLNVQLTEDQAIVDDLTVQAADLTEAVRGNLDTIVSLANDRATAQDDQILMRDLTVAFQECISAREELVGYVKNRSLWDEASLHDWENYVDDYCSQIHDVYTELVDRDATR